MSVNQSLIIYKFPILFNILNEIRSKLNFKIIYYDNKDFNNFLDTTNAVVISGEKKNVVKNQIKISEYPINIQKLIEIINIQFLKNKFNQQINIKAGKYFINLNSREMKYNDQILQITEKELKIINFLNSSKGPVSISKLQSEVWGYNSTLETHTVETHVYRLRKKVEKKFKDKAFIVSLKNGYKIET